ncbi:hypothetical protein CAMGR0001_0854 [Campylobacter gracilis RM3268]|uniref:Uncharacterized protein n=1 Tax=Campylobacter gracilis RM3268 TaxID=553220 RepID=C8PG61_9BACT|nr:hypothetical protein CAMGR0001_0854 [Campylobacter gracilis RM3268]
MPDAILRDLAGVFLSKGFERVWRAIYKVARPDRRLVEACGAICLNR